MRGTESGFEPNLSVTRAMLVTILYRMADEPIVDENTVFNDVKDGEWYTSAVAWASKNGIVYGISENEFAPDIDITREELSTMLYRFAGYEKYDLTAADENNFNKYDDGNIVSDYAVKAVNWCIACGIINGRTDRTIAPKDNAIRAELAVIVMRFYEHVK